MKAVIQEETSGRGIAASAVLAGVSYAEAKRRANALGIDAEDTSLWSETAHVRKLLSDLGISVSAEETPFESWERLPDKALLAIEMARQTGQPTLALGCVCQGRPRSKGSGLQESAENERSP